VIHPFLEHEGARNESRSKLTFVPLSPLSFLRISGSLLHVHSSSPLTLRASDSPSTSYSNHPRQILSSIISSSSRPSLRPLFLVVSITYFLPLPAHLSFLAQPNPDAYSLVVFLLISPHPSSIPLLPLLALLLRQSSNSSRRRESTWTASLS